MPHIYSKESRLTDYMEQISFWEVNISSAIQGIPPTSWRFITVFIKACHLSISLFRSVQSTPSYSGSIRPILILFPIYTYVFQVSMSLKFTHQNRVLCNCFVKTGVFNHAIKFNLNFMPSRVDIWLTQPNTLHVNSGFCHSVEEIFSFLGCYAV